MLKFLILDWQSCLVQEKVILQQELWVPLGKAQFKDISSFWFPFLNLFLFWF